MLGCEYGDHNPRHCEGHRRSDCYDSSYRGRCCDTCSRYEPGPAGCEFGDRAQFCANQEPSDCYNNKNTCCETCRRVVTGPTGKTLVTQTRQMLNISLPILAAFFPGKTGLANFTEAKEDENGGNNWSYKSYKAQSNYHHQQTITQLFTSRMPFLSPNQQCQSTEGKANCKYVIDKYTCMQIVSIFHFQYLLFNNSLSVVFCCRASF